MRLLASDPVWQTCYPPFGFSCFLPDTPIAGRVIGGSQARYVGQAVELRTAVGRRLTVTANHPILTPRGFVPAQALAEGDEVIGYRGEAGIAALGSGGQRNEYEAPARAEDVFRALAQAGIASMSGSGPDDFHGEARCFDGDVHVVGSYRALALHLLAASAEQGHEVILEAPALPDACLVGDRSAAFFREGAHASAARRPRAVQLAAYARRILAEMLPLQEFRFGAAAQVDVMLRQHAAEGLAADAQLVGELLHGCPGAVTRDHLVYVRHYDFCGHVYDLHSPLGWIVASGIVTSNCRCRVVVQPASAQGGTVPGSALAALPIPDPGFTAGIAPLL
jgi:hypothetical protein